MDKAASGESRKGIQTSQCSGLSRGILTIEQLIFAANLLSMWSVAFSMLSIISLIRLLSPAQWHRKFTLGLAVGTIIWIITGTFGFAFQCSLPKSWDFIHQQCMQRKGFFTAHATIHLLLETLLVLHPVFLAWNLQLSVSQRALIIFSFMGRLT